MALEEDLVEVARLPRVETAQPEVVDDEDVGSEQAAQHLPLEWSARAWWRDWSMWSARRKSTS